jgi:large subunit ribosomal protein L10
LAITKEKKKQIVADYVDKMSSSQAMILTDYRGLNVASITELRRRMREVDGGLQVVKNTLFKRALDEAGISVPMEDHEGPLAIGYCFEEVPPVAKVLLDFAKESQALKVHGAVLGDKMLDLAGVRSLADLPPREVLLAQLLSAVQGPMSGLVNTLQAPMRELVQVLSARAEQGQEAAEAA